jgi:UPF0755 protein
MEVFMSDREDKKQNNEPVPDEELSIDELLRSAREELAHVDDMMGPDSGHKPGADGKAENKLPPFEPRLPEEYADLTVDEEQEEEEPEPRKGGLPAGARVLIYVCCVLAASVLLALGAWKCADDVLALTKPDRTVTVTIQDGASISDVSRELQEQGLIKYPWLFKFYCWFSHAEKKIDPGTYELNNLYDYHALVNGMIETSGDRAVVTITVPEGTESAEVFQMLADKGVCTLEQLQDTAANHEYDYKFLQELPYGDQKRLEGYLFPDTYDFYVGDDPVNVIDKFLKNFDSKITDDMYTALDTLNAQLAEKMKTGGFTDEEIANSKLSMHDIIIVASLVEKETAKTSESATIASVIYNRLCSKLYPCLQIDATIQYVLDERKEVLTNADKSILSPYNTYTNAGLPAGPIANPGINSIRAALYPAETSYYFYALGADGVHHFSETYYEHQAFLDTLQSGTDNTADDGTTTDTGTTADTQNGQDTNDGQTNTGG